MKTEEENVNQLWTMEEAVMLYCWPFCSTQCQKALGTTHAIMTWNTDESTKNGPASNTGVLGSGFLQALSCTSQESDKTCSLNRAQRFAHKDLLLKAAAIKSKVRIIFPHFISYYFCKFQPNQRKLISVAGCQHFIIYFHHQGLFVQIKLN